MQLLALGSWPLARPSRRPSSRRRYKRCKLVKNVEDDASQLNRSGATPSQQPKANGQEPLYVRQVNFMVKPNERLVLVSCTPYGASTPSLLNRWSSCALLDPYGLGDLILGSVSRLYAFSGYHNRTSLPSRAVVTTAGTQEVRSSRSSRTKDKPPQISSAHIR